MFGPDNRHRLGDLNPPIENCRGGLDGSNLHGSLSSDEVEEVRRVQISPHIDDQEGLDKKVQCESFEGEALIVYFPAEVVSRWRLAGTMIRAWCCNEGCKFNTTNRS